MYLRVNQSLRQLWNVTYKMTCKKKKTACVKDKSKKYNISLFHNENFAEIINDIKNAYSIKLNDSSANLNLGSI